MDAGMMLMDPTREHKPVHGAGHLHISKNDVHQLPGCEDRDRLGRIRRFDNFLSSAPEMIGNR
jgi:hypothetical protein